MKFRMLRLCSTAVALLTFAITPLRAGEIRGRITDPSGAPVEGAQVRLEDLATGAIMVIESCSEGRYRFVEVARGAYRLSSQAEGFSEEGRSLVLAHDQQDADVDFALALGHLQTTVTVTATRSLRDSLGVPLRAESIGSEEIRFANPASTGDLMVQAPGITPVANGPFQVRPRLRGLDSTRVLVLIDGERLNNARTATDRAGVEVGLVDISTVESVEVVSGSGSVLYGTDALSGTINVITRHPDFGDAFHMTAAGHGYYSTNENGRRGAFAVGASASRMAFTLSGGRDSFDDYASGGKNGTLLEDSRSLHASGQLKQQDTIDTNFPPFAFHAFPDPFNAPYTRTLTAIPNSAAQGEHLNAAGLLGLGERQSLRVKYIHRTAENVGFPDFQQPFFFQGITLPFSKLDKVSARYQIQSIRPWFSNLTATLYTQRQDRKVRNVDVPVQFPVPTAATFFPINVMRLVINSDTEQKVKTYGFDLQNTFLISPRNVLTAGLTLYRDQSRDDRVTSSQMNLIGSVALGAGGPAPVVLPRPQPLGPPTLTNPVRVPDSSLRDFGLFAQDEWDLTSRLHAVAGLRLDSYAVETTPTPGYDIEGVVAGALPAIDRATLPDPNGDYIRRSALTGDAGLVFKATRTLSVAARYGRSYRHPNLEELLFAGPATIGSIAPNVKLGPERGDNFDIGLKLRASRLRGSLSYFDNTYQGFVSTEIVALTPGSSVSQAINFAKVRIWGIESDCSVSVASGPLAATLFGSAAFNRGDVLEGRNPLTHATLDGTPQDNITPFKLIVGGRVADRKSRGWAEYSLRHQKRVDRVATTLSQSPFLLGQDLLGLQGFTIQRAGLGYDWTREGKSFGVSVNVENLGNKYYREQFQFAPARGRSITFGIHLRKS